MKRFIFILTALLFNFSITYGQSKIKEDLKKLSLDKWVWMAERDIEKLERLFHPQSQICPHERDLEYPKRAGNH